MKDQVQKFTEIIDTCIDMEKQYDQLITDVTAEQEVLAAIKAEINQIEAKLKSLLEENGK